MKNPASGLPGPAKGNCVLFSIIATSSVHQYPAPQFWGTNAECDAERLRRDPDARHGLKVARLEDLHKYHA